jgi:CheY-like chemotaxis protein
MMLPDSAFSSTEFAWRILVVENDPTQRASLMELLRGWKYKVYEVPENELQSGKTDRDQFLLNNAILKLEEYHCDLLLVDLRLDSDENKEDSSGGDLAKAILQVYPGLKIVFRSGYAVPHSLSDWPCVGKGDGAEALKRIIEDTLVQIHIADQ